MMFLPFLLLFGLGACMDGRRIGAVPGFSNDGNNHSVFAVNTTSARSQTWGPEQAHASLWDSGPTSLLGDRRAVSKGDLLTVVIEINDKAEISNSSRVSRQAAEKMGIPALAGIPQWLDSRLPTGATSENLVGLSSDSSSSGDGSVKRNEKLTLRMAATVSNVLPNGHLEIQGRQEVRVNYELRELLVTGFVRPEDISRKNEITYDKIASARISYGGRGQVSTAQSARKGKLALDAVLPF